MTSDIRTIPIEEIAIYGRLRDVNEVEADRIGASMRDDGQITPIMVAAQPDGRFRLVAGAHRVEGARRYGLQHLSAVVIEGSPDELRLREIDENLYRHELSAYDVAAFIAERREVWERLFGPIKPGGARGAKGQVCPLDEELKRAGFVKATAARFNLHPKAVKRALQRRAHIVPSLWNALKGSEAARNASFLDALARADVEMQHEVLRRVKERGVTFEAAFADTRRASVPQVVDQTPNLSAIKRAWAKASNPERLAIVAFITHETKKRGGK